MKSTKLLILISKWHKAQTEGFLLCLMQNACLQEKAYFPKVRKEQQEQKDIFFLCPLRE